MDSITHIHFAKRLLRMAGLDESAAICSLFPQLDRHPAYFHRMYGHPISRARGIVELGIDLFWDGEVAPSVRNSYEVKRLAEERQRMTEFLRQSGTAESLKDLERPNVLSGVVAHISHVYQDIFNNPMQAFLPWYSIPCGKWELWDSFESCDFRKFLYSPSNIKAFREELFSAPLWSSTVTPGALLQGMIGLTAQACARPVPATAISNALNSLHADLSASDEEILHCTRLLSMYEDLMHRLIVKYGQTGDLNDIPVRS